MTPDQWLQVMLAGFTAVCGGAGVYAAIRGDLARTRAIAENAADAAKTAHARIDSIYSTRRN